MTHANFDVDDLIIRYLNGETTTSENHSFSKWLNESSENLSYFNSIRNVWLASSQSIPFLHTTTTYKVNSKPQKYRLFNTLLKTAAFFALIIIVSVLLYNNFKSTENSNSRVTVEATIGSRANTTLPDGTKVWLNSGSKLEYDLAYNGKTREVKLIGEAYFTVVTNPSKPFVVKAGKLSIKALGTIFNVKAYPEDRAIITTLVKGKVIIEGKDDKNKNFVVQMKPKEAVTYFKRCNSVIGEDEQKRTQQQSAQKFSENPDHEIATFPVEKIEQVNTELFTSWKDARWVIEKQKLGDLAPDFERRYNIKIQFLSDKIKQFHFTGILENETIEQIMVIMRHTIPLEYKIEKGVIKIGADKDLMKKFYE